MIKAIRKNTTLDPIIEEPNIEQTDVKFVFYNKPLVINCKIRINNIKSASYYRPTDLPVKNLYIYKLLVSFAHAHKKTIACTNYKIPFNTDGFTFTTTPTVKYYNKHNTISLIDKAVGELVLATIKVIPYNYEERAGLSIALLKAKQL